MKAKPPPNVRLKAALPRDVNEKLAIIRPTVQSSYDHAIKIYNAAPRSAKDNFI